MRRQASAIVLMLAIALPVLAIEAQPAPPKKKRHPPSSRYTPPSAAQSVDIGNYYFSQKAFRGALSRYREATHTDPGYAPAYMGLGKVYEKLGEKKRALAAYRKYLAELPSERQAKRDKVAHRAIERLERELNSAPGASPSSRKPPSHQL